PAKSLLVEAVRYENPDLQMPPKGKKLAPEQIDAIAEWVKAGAPWPESDQKLTARPKGKITDEDRQWWAIQPLAKVDPPKLEGSGNEIDGFIRMRLKQEGLKPAPPAAPHQLIRRL